MPTPDAIAAAAVDVARAAACAEARDPARVGDHLGVDPEGERCVLHRFACADPAYRGWYWGVELGRAARARIATVVDVVLLPGEDSLLAPPWVPWSQRLRPGDVGVGDLLPTAADDERLTPGFTAAGAATLSGDDPAVELWWELGLGRPRLLSAAGRDDAAQRWWEAETGPHSEVARAAPARCASCGFYVPLAGSLGQLFGACANAFAPDDARVVAADHGCGAHSEALVLPSARPAPLSFDDAAVDLVDTGSEPYGHS